MNNILVKYRTFWICLVLALAAFAIFYQVRSFGFVNLDDPVYVSQNPNIQAGISLNTVKWAFTTGYAKNWHPLTWLSLMLTGRCLALIRQVSTSLICFFI
jgi:hypothetical protein